METNFSKNVRCTVLQNSSLAGLKNNINDYLANSTLFFVNVEIFYVPTNQSVEGNITGLYTCYIVENNGLY